MNLFDLSLRLSGFDIASAKQELARIKAIPENEYDSYLTKKKQEIASYHLKNNSFYKSLVGENPDLVWEHLPIMTKSDLQQPLQNRLSNGYTAKNSHVHKTSGSSGHPFIFAKDKKSHALSWASFYDRYSWYDINLSKDLQARFYGIPLTGFEHYKERLKDKLSNRYRFSIFDLSSTNLQSFVERFKKMPFVYINGYTSSIVLFAKYLKEKNIRLTSICPSLKLCIVTSEMLFNEDRVLIEEQLGVPVVNEYGASETGLIAFENPKKDWAIDHELLYVEIVDDNNIVLQNGEMGRIVITSLYNTAHPFIRYDIGDLGTLSNQSTSKNPVLLKLGGRINDIAQLPSGKVVPGLTFYYVTKKVIDDSSFVKEFVVTQLETDSFLIEYVAERNLSEKEIAKIKKEIAKYLEPNLNVTFERLLHLDRSKRGKLKQFHSLI